MPLYSPTMRGLARVVSEMLDHLGVGRVDVLGARAVVGLITEFLTVADPSA